MLASAVVLGVVLIVFLALAGLRLLQLAYRAIDRRVDEREGAGRAARESLPPGRAGPRT